eukprot:TRINITY_DN6476_c0_g1_i2.p1 TRINITY_DN6476_c0_g1~~TRINITY_DN6476_c0_g1_i2.p1  ORF type:complete len:665 (-),score=128.63 TRINITY_DN6476_c0_g1_i2:370-2364(-)
MPLGHGEGDKSISRYCGVETRFSNDVHETVRQSLNEGFDFVVLPLVDPNYRPSQASEDPDRGSVPPFAGSDLDLNPAQWNSHVVGLISPWIDLDSEDNEIRLDSETALRQEISWASHLSLQACILPTPKGSSCANYARCVNEILQGSNVLQLWIRIPFLYEDSDTAEVASEKGDIAWGRDELSPKQNHDSWELWNTFRLLCDHHSQLSLALDILNSLPYPHLVDRWVGEPVRVAIIQTNAFLTNARGFPCLAKRHQNLVTTFFDHSVQVIISGEARHHGRSVASECQADKNDDDKPDCQLPKFNLKPYLQYVAYLYQRMEPLSDQERFEVGYRDFLQSPLQPLMDNLEAQTYETFEKDCVKYSQYQKAVHAALLDRVPDGEATKRVTVLMVVGAGRGPLVRASLQAAKESGRRLKVYAVEKNPNAAVTLHSLIKREHWDGMVTVVSKDMRYWDAPEKADIVVSELLGSFGDNELSPECLDGAQRFLKDDGISIPSSYTSFLEPITATKLYNDIKSHKDIAHFETAYVVKLHSIARLSSRHPVFTFVHPNRSSKPDNQRHKKLKFELRKESGSALVHGFAGYFDATLYKDIHLGIEPSTATPNMFSWFAIFFPLRKPIYWPAGSALKVDFWRCVGKAKVWYEWAVTTPAVSPIHNPGGRSYWVGL